jgi:hypothetical protein
MSAPRDIYGPARKLARPVARGWLPLEQAYADLLVTTLREERSGELGQRTAPDVFRFKRFLLQTEVTRLEVARDLASHRICRLIKPMIALRKPWGSLMAEAHNLNGEAGFPLTESEVTELVETEVWWALPQAPTGGRRHVG